MSYKLSTGLPQDPKLTIIAQKAGLPRGAALAIWIALIDHASKARPRGSLAAIKPDEIAAVLECTSGDVSAVVAALKEKNLVTPDDAIVHWHRYQRLSTPRVRAHRARNQIDAHRARKMTDQKTTGIVNGQIDETDAARRNRLRQEVAVRRGKCTAATGVRRGAAPDALV